MTEVKRQALQMQALLGLHFPPVAIAFRAAPPPGMRRIESSAAAGCAYWRLAAEGKIFYTEARDHYACPVGAHTHGVELPPAVAKELNGLVQTMVGMQYISMEEIPSIPRLSGAFGVAMYAPLEETPFDPDIVLVRGAPKQLMLLAEAAQAAGVAGDGATLGRPTCSILPQTIESERPATSFGCIGNRVYTGLGDDEGYYAIPGIHVAEIVSRLAAITEANRRLEQFHQSRVGRNAADSAPPS